MQAVASLPFPEDGRASFCPFHNAWLLGQCCFHKSNGQNWKKWGLCLSLLGAWRGTLDHSVFPGSLRGFKVQGFEGTKGFSRHETCFIQSRKERRKEKTCVRGAFVDN